MTRSQNVADWTEEQKKEYVDGVMSRLKRVRGFEPVSKYSNDEIKMPVRATVGSAGYDIFNNTGSEIIIEPGELSEAITTKLKSYMQYDEVLMIYPRSGHGFKYSVRLANSVGVVDQSYWGNPTNDGEIFVKFHNQGTKTLRIPVGEAFAQGIFTKYLLADGDDYFSGTKRIGGLGSTTGKV